MNTQTTPHGKLALRDFAYVRDPLAGQTYRCGHYTILAGRETYAVAYKGQTFSWAHYSLLEAIDACNRQARQHAQQGGYGVAK